MMRQWSEDPKGADIIAGKYRSGLEVRKISRVLAKSVGRSGMRVGETISWERSLRMGNYSASEPGRSVPREWERLLELWTLKSPRMII